MEQIKGQWMTRVPFMELTRVVRVYKGYFHQLTESI